MNKREVAEQYLDKAKHALRGNDFSKAERLLVKSMQKYPLEEARRLLTNLKEREKSQQQKTRQEHQRRQQRQRRQPPQQNKSSTDTKIDEAMKNSKDPEVIRILGEKDYYQIFDVPKNFVEKALKKKYRKLASKVHPDKNKDVGAEEAFKKIAKAYECLSDPEKRKIYDRYGTETPEMHAQFNRSYGQMSPEDLFEAMFMGGRMGGRRGGTHFYQFGGNRSQARPANAEPVTGWQAFVQVISQFLPILLLLSMSFGGSGGDNTNTIFAFERDHTYNTRRESPLGTEFYVTKQFHRQYGQRENTLNEIHNRVESTYVEILFAECDNEKLRKTQLYRQASKEKGEVRMEHLRDLDSDTLLASCNRLDDYLAKQ